MSAAAATLAQPRHGRRRVKPIRAILTETEEELNRVKREARFWREVAEGESHPLRMKILDVYREGEEASPKTLSLRLKEPLGKVAYHVKVLLDAGLIVLRKEEPRRGATEHIYVIASKARRA